MRSWQHHADMYAPTNRRVRDDGNVLVPSQRASALRDVIRSGCCRRRRLQTPVGSGCRTSSIVDTERHVLLRLVHDAVRGVERVVTRS